MKKQYKVFHGSAVSLADLMSMVTGVLHHFVCKGWEPKVGDLNQSCIAAVRVEVDPLQLELLEKGGFICEQVICEQA